ncbi:MAG: arginine--tRNA ligase [Oscillospiraceae bacterium]|jgi:arginyl-tRNA synthetase|nr:arginine--tRNA ligase [Oscillospiraceae bacterium]
MTNIVFEARVKIRKSLQSAIRSGVDDGIFPDDAAPINFIIEIPADSSHGDFATNIAMLYAKPFNMTPRKIAEEIVGRIEIDAEYFEKAEVAGPGFINFRLKRRWFSYAVKKALEDGGNYGRSSYGGGKKVVVEFVSANPTGPMHMGNARGGALGDSLAAALDFAGYLVSREFYINDAGSQIAKFAKSLEARYLQIFKPETPFPEDGYQGGDIKDLARQFADIHGDEYLDKDEKLRQDIMIAFALPRNIEKLKADLGTYRVFYDVWFSEKSLHESGAVERALGLLGDNGYTYEKDGALWYKSTAFGEEKDEVLVRANGIPTYFAADIAYHYDKLAVRGFDKAINVWGADHHGHVARMKNAMKAMGLDSSRLDVVIMQMVNLVRDGKPVRMSKRTGRAISLADLLEEVPIDAARFFFNMRDPASHLDFDLDLAIEESNNNPVYYVQYAYARICSIVKNLAAEGIESRETSLDELDLLSSGEERELIRHVAVLPDEIIAAAEQYDPAKLTRYCIELAARFHKFYNNCYIRGEAEPLLQARLALCLCVKNVIENVFGMLKITAPESM